MKCAYCGAENPDDKKFCGYCGAPLRQAEGIEMRWRKPLARQISLVIVVASVASILISLGFNSAAEDLKREGILLHDYGLGEVSSEFFDIAWLFGWLGIMGMFSAGFAYLLSLPVPRKVKQGPQREAAEGAPSSGEETDDSGSGRTP